MGATSNEKHRLGTRSDFQRFCAELRTSSPGLDVVVGALRDLAESALRPMERGRFAHIIVRYLGATFAAPEVRAVASQAWPPEIAMVLRSQVPAQEESPVAMPAPSPEHDARLPERNARLPERNARLPERPPERNAGADLRELARERSFPLTVVFLGDEDEHRASMERLKDMGIHCLRESSLDALSHAFAHEVVVGLVVGASWWATSDPRPRPPGRRLRSVLELSNLCWVKLIRGPLWTSVEDKLAELCTSCHLAQPPRSRLAVEDRAMITAAELSCLAEATQDIIYGERMFSHDALPSPAQERILRAATSRYLQAKFPAVHKQESGFRVRTLGNRGENGLVSLVSVPDTEVAFVIKVSPYEDALAEGQRFRSLAHGISLEMEFYCHGMQGALVFTPVGTRLGEARSLEDMLAPRELVKPGHMPAGSMAAIDSAIAALQRFSQQIQPGSQNTFCSVEHEGTERLLKSCGPFTIAGETIDLAALHAKGRQALTRCTSKSAVQHGDAHPGNILFSATSSAVLIDYESAGLGPACYDLSMLWIHVLASRFVAAGDERATVRLLGDLLQGVSFEELQERWPGELRFVASQEAVYLAHRALDASVSVMAERGYAREDVYGVLAVILCRELLNAELQQFVMRCALAALSSVLVEKPV